MSERLGRERLEEIRARCEAATEGPWWWNVRPVNHFVELIGKGWHIVFDARRWGMSGATLRFRKADDLMYPAQEMSIPFPGQEHNAKWQRTLEHPDATFIAHARQDVPALLAHIAALEAEVAVWTETAKQGATDEAR